jgi:hypothetical protein
MNRLYFAIPLLISCATAVDDTKQNVNPFPQPDPDMEDIQLPPSSPLVLTAPATAQPGDTIAVMVTLPSFAPASAQNGMNVFFPSTTGGLGTGFCGGPLGSDCLDIMGSLNLLGPVQTSGGQATLLYTIPTGFSERALYVQAVIIAPARAFLSNAVEINVPSGSGVCGDGFVNLGEVCDDGSNIGADVGDCAPGCEQLVRAKRYIYAMGSATGNLHRMRGSSMDGTTQPLPAHLDGWVGCRERGLKTMFSDGVTRVASVSPHQGDGQVDWVLEPWVAYYSYNLVDPGLSQHIWTTDDSALLGVRGGQPQDLLVNTVIGRPSSSTNPSSDWEVWTGMDADWTTTSDDCNGWRSADAGDVSSYGMTETRPWSVTATNMAVEDLLSGGSGSCDESHNFLCVEQTPDPDEACVLPVVIAGQSISSSNLNYRGALMDSAGRVHVPFGSATSTYNPIPGGPYVDMRSEGYTTCALDEDGAVYCHGSNADYSAALDEYVALVSTHCGILSNGEVHCWDPDYSGPETAGWSQADCDSECCGIRNGELECWGRDVDIYGQAGRWPETDETFVSADMGSRTAGYPHLGCALTDEGHAMCWGSRLYGMGMMPAPENVVFSDVRVGDDYACGIDCNQRIRCWGALDLTTTGAAPPPIPLPFTEPSGRFVSLNHDATCGLTVEHEMVCWNAQPHPDLEPDPADQWPWFLPWDMCDVDVDPFVVDDRDCDGAPTTNDCDDNDTSVGDQRQDADCDGISTDQDCDDNDASIATAWVGHCEDCADDYTPNQIAGLAHVSSFSVASGFTATLSDARSCRATPTDYYALSVAPGSVVDVTLDWSDDTAALVLTVLERRRSTVLGGLDRWVDVATGTCTTDSCSVTYTTTALQDWVVKTDLVTASSQDVDQDGNYDAVTYDLTYGPR